MAGSVEAKQFLLSELSVVRLIHSSDSSNIFVVKHKGAKYCLKVVSQETNVVSGSRQ